MSKDTIREELIKAIIPPTKHPTLGVMTLHDGLGMSTNGEIAVTGDTSAMLDRLESLIKREQDVKIESTLQELTGLWMKYVSINHHKDRDCHWYVELDYAYGGEPLYKIYHYGYVFENIDYENAICGQGDYRSELVKLILRAFSEEKEWVDKVIKYSDGYDSTQVEQARFYKKIEPRLAELKQDNKEEK